MCECECGMNECECMCLGLAPGLVLRVAPWVPFGSAAASAVPLGRLALVVVPASAVPLGRLALVGVVASGPVRGRLALVAAVASVVRRGVWRGLLFSLLLCRSGLGPPAAALSAFGGPLRLRRRRLCFPLCLGFVFIIVCRRAII